MGLGGQDRYAHSGSGGHPVGPVLPGVTLGVISAALAVAGHVVGGGQVAVAASLVLTVAACAVAIAVSGRAVRPTRLLALAGAAQVAGHLVLMGGAPEAHSEGTAGHSMAMSMSSMGPAHSNWVDRNWMLLAHLLATVVSALVLRIGAVTLAGVGRLLRSGLAVARPRPASVPLAPELVHPWASGSVPALEVFASVVPSRGPPRAG